MKSVEAISAASASKSTCDNCGLPTAAPVMPGEPTFCCFGCRFSAGISNPAVTTRNPLKPASALGICILFSVTAVLMTIALWYCNDQEQRRFQTGMGDFLRFGAMAFSLPVLLLLGDPLVSHAISGLRRGQFTADLLLATTVVAAFTVSVIHTICGDGPVYFDVGCVVLVLVTIGRWLEAAGRSQASSGLEQLEQMIPTKVRRLINRREVETPHWLVSVGNHVRVVAGRRIPLDGRVVEGRAVVDEHFFTGESSPVEKQCGDPVLGGSLNLDGDLTVEVTTPLNRGVLGRLVESVRAARLTKGGYQTFCETWSRWLFPAVALIAGGSFLYHGLQSSWDSGMLAAMSVVLMACPCALATPLAFWAAFGTAAKRGVLFSGSDALETLAATRAIRWAKTGTLTLGSPRVLQLFCEHASERSDVEQIAAGMTSDSNHCYSLAIHDFLAGAPPSEPIVDIQTVAGRGLRAFDPDGRHFVLGSIHWMEDCGYAWGPCLSRVRQDARLSGCPLTAIAYDGEVRGLFLLEESIRPEATAALRQCHELGLNQAVLTSDRAAHAAVLAKTVGIPVEVASLPEEKLRAMRNAHECHGTVAMVGDVVNDSVALAAADISIAIGRGANFDDDAMSLSLLSNDPRLVAWSYEFARHTVQTIRTNLGLSFCLNSVGVIVAASGQLHPGLAAALMVISSSIVLGNALKLTDGELVPSASGLEI